MISAFCVLVFAVFSPTLQLAQEAPPRPSFEHKVASDHEIQPHRRTIPHEGVPGGFNQLHLTLVVSAKGDVLSAEADGDKESPASLARLESRSTWLEVHAL